MIAEQRWVRAIQHDAFNKEVNFCRDNPKVIPSGMKVISSKVQQLGLFLDESGVMRVRTRLRHADNPDVAREPMLLPKHGHFTDMIIRRIHRLLKHAGVARVLAELRNMYWIASGKESLETVCDLQENARISLSSFGASRFARLQGAARGMLRSYRC